MVGARAAFGSMARLLLRLRVSPNWLTVLGAALTMVGAVAFVARGQLLTAFAVVTAGCLCDMLDGEVARQGGRVSRFGALLDSTLDRVSDGAILGALSFWLFLSGRPWAAAASLTCLVTAHLVAYVRARAEGLGVSGEVGLGARRSRLIVVGLAVLAVRFGPGWLAGALLWSLAVLSAVTVVQRLVHAGRQLRAADVAVPTERDLDHTY